MFLVAFNDAKPLLEMASLALLWFGKVFANDPTPLIRAPSSNLF
jgi:hypothetical protein